MHILYQMLKAKSTHSETLSPAVPKMQSINVPLSAIGKIIGPGGAMIRSLIEEFGLINIDIAEGVDQGTVMISSLSEEKNQKATEKVPTPLKPCLLSACLHQAVPAGGPKYAAA